MTLVEAKKHLEIAAVDPRHDGHITGLITAARQAWERDTQTITVPREVTEHHFQIYERMRLAYRPVISVTSVTNNGTTIAAPDYSVDLPRRMIHFDTTPIVSVNGDWNDVEIKYQAGYATVPQVMIQAMKLQLDLMFQPEKMLKYHREAYENMVKPYLRPTYP